MSCQSIRACAADPIGYWFPEWSSAAKRAESPVRWTLNAPADVERLVTDWETYLESRALDSMHPDMIRSLLEQIATKIDRGSPDPVLDDGCCIWHGSFFEGHPVIHMKKPGKDDGTSASTRSFAAASSDDNVQPTYVNRILAFFFANDSRFSALHSMPKTAFPMCCGRKDCISFKHIWDPRATSGMLSSTVGSRKGEEVDGRETTGAQQHAESSSTRRKSNYNTSRSPEKQQHQQMKASYSPGGRPSTYQSRDQHFSGGGGRTSSMHLSSGAATRGYSASSRAAPVLLHNQNYNYSTHAAHMRSRSPALFYSENNQSDQEVADTSHHGDQNYDEIWEEDQGVEQDQRHSSSTRRNEPSSREERSSRGRR
ncbi:unnamed protein product [Amoebophrya sp. A25]|nr:unnamed protein product [Amoebophrya sp. A25]|eukprot:GSA25T00010046001.1